jgi:hypothetical protein
MRGAMLKKFWCLYIDQFIWKGVSPGAVICAPVLQRGSGPYEAQSVKRT